MDGLIGDVNRLLSKQSKLFFKKESHIILGEIEIISQEEPNLGVLSSYEVEIRLPKQYPLVVFPKVFETNGKIPKDPHRHINHDGSFCLAVRPEEFQICRQGINLLQFIDTIVIPFLAVQSALNEGLIDSFPQGEFDHGSKGIFEFYQNKLNLESPKVMLEGIKLVLRNNITRNSRCFCGSGKKTKRCHLEKLVELTHYPKMLLLQDFYDIKSTMVKN